MIQTPHAVDIIARKRDGQELSPAEIQAFIHGVTEGRITEARTAAFLMAVFLRGLSPNELATLTTAMRDSGEVFNVSALRRYTADKHSTGGVGDKTSLLIAPVCAAAGLAVPMISGRSLGHTGGTLDKLETIPGFRTDLSLAEFEAVIQDCGCCMIGQTPRLAPADRILYALRDHTATVASPDLICASIMSKKLAEGLRGLVLDVKTGSGAFLRDEDQARHLARLMVDTGNLAGTRTVALLTGMEEPLGRFSGNWLEVRECLDILQGKAHPLDSDTVELSATLAGWMLHMGEKAATPEEGRQLAFDLIRNGEAYRCWLRMVDLQGGDIGAFDNPENLHKAPFSQAIHAPESAFLAGMDCTAMGWAIQRLGVGREKPGDPVSPSAGLEMHAKLGDWVEKGQPLVTLFGDSKHGLRDAAQSIGPVLRFTQAPPKLSPLVREVIDRG